MAIVCSPQRLRSIGAALALALGIAGYLASRVDGDPIPSTPAAEVPSPPQLRGVWVQGRSIVSREKIDAVLDRAAAGRFDAIFVGVFGQGQTLYQSALAPKHERVDPAFDPLAYLVPAAHQRNIEVHAWFASGRVGDENGSPILAQHPAWGLVGPDGKTTPWLNFSRPDVRQFMSDLVLETVERYGVDGVHFDYMRYPDPEWGFDPDNAAAFAKEYGFDLDQLRYADLPAYGVFSGNALGEPTSAQILAMFANGLPAVALNAYGAGEVVLLNWNASARRVAAESEILQRSLRRLLDTGGQIYLLRSETNAEDYGYKGFEGAQAWLRHLGWQPRPVDETDVFDLPPDSVLILPNVYLITPETAEDLADFADRGGGIIFIDGPTRSIGLKVIQALTGMRSRARYFSELTLLRPNGEHPLIPSSDRDWSMETYQLWDARWKAFRKQGINEVIKDVYRRAKATCECVDVSVTITSDQEAAAQEVLQDWPAWLAGEYIDFLVPRGYVDDSNDLRSVIGVWRPAILQHGRITLGLIAFRNDSGSQIAKPPDQLLTEIRMASNVGSNGIMIFDLDRMSDEQLAALAAGPFSSEPRPAGAAVR